MAGYLDGVTRREFVLDGSSWIVADRLGFHIDLGGGEHHDVGLTMMSWRDVIYEYLDMFKGTYSAGGAGPAPFVLSKEQRTTVFKAIVAARILELPAVTDAGGGEPADNYELEVRNGGRRHTVSWSQSSADRSLTALMRTVLNMLNPNPGDGCVGAPPKVR